ncbi:MAG: Uncharacterized protein conserved in bacteria, partial [uncultured Arthrobacter sp.]
EPRESPRRLPRPRAAADPRHRRRERHRQARRRRGGEGAPAGADRRPSGRPQKPRRPRQGRVRLRPGGRRLLERRAWPLDRARTVRGEPEAGGNRCQQRGDRRTVEHQRRGVRGDDAADPLRQLRPAPGRVRLDPALHRRKPSGSLPPGGEGRVGAGRRRGRRHLAPGPRSDHRPGGRRARRRSRCAPAGGRRAGAHPCPAGPQGGGAGPRRRL